MLVAALILSLAPTAPAAPSERAEGPRLAEPFAYRRRPLSLLGPVAPPIAIERGAWVPFYLLGRGRHGTWSLAGSSISSSMPMCADKRSNCLPIDQAGIALVWQLDRVPIMFFAGIVFINPSLGAAVGASARKQGRPVPTAGMIITLPDLLDAVKFTRGIPTMWGSNLAK